MPAHRALPPALAALALAPGQPAVHLRDDLRARRAGIGAVAYTHRACREAGLGLEAQGTDS